MFHCGQASLSSLAPQSRSAGFSEPEVGIEPTTFGLQDRRSSRLSYSGGKLCRRCLQMPKQQKQQG